MSCVDDEQDGGQSNGNDLKSPEPHVTNRAEIVEADVFTTGLFDIASESSLFVVINCVANSSNDDDSEEEYRRDPDFSDEGGVFCNFFEQFLYDMPSHSFEKKKSLC